MQFFFNLAQQGRLSDVVQDIQRGRCISNTTQLVRGRAFLKRRDKLSYNTWFIFQISKPPWNVFDTFSSKRM